jgi:hypothetical protein
VKIKVKDPNVKDPKTLVQSRNQTNNEHPYYIYPKTLPLSSKPTFQCLPQYARAHTSIVPYAIHTIRHLIYIKLRTWVVGTPTQLQCL